MGGSFRFLALTSLLVAYVVHVESETCRDAGHDTHCDARAFSTFDDILVFDATKKPMNSVSITCYGSHNCFRHKVQVVWFINDTQEDSYYKANSDLKKQYLDSGISIRSNGSAYECYSTLIVPVKEKLNSTKIWCGAYTEACPGVIKHLSNTTTIITKIKDPLSIEPTIREIDTNESTVTLTQIPPSPQPTVPTDEDEEDENSITTEEPIIKRIWVAYFQDLIKDWIWLFHWLAYFLLYLLLLLILLYIALRLLIMLQRLWWVYCTDLRKSISRVADFIKKGLRSSWVYFVGCIMYVTKAFLTILHTIWVYFVGSILFVKKIFVTIMQTVYSIFVLRSGTKFYSMIEKTRIYCKKVVVVISEVITYPISAFRRYRVTRKVEKKVIYHPPSPPPPTYIPKPFVKKPVHYERDQRWVRDEVYKEEVMDGLGNLPRQTHFHRREVFEGRGNLPRHTQVHTPHSGSYSSASTSLSTPRRSTRQRKS